MSIRDWFKFRADAEVKIQAHDLSVGNNANTPNVRIASRLCNLYDWMEQKGESATIEKVDERKASLKRHSYTLAGRGFKLCKSREDAYAILRKVIEETE